MARKLPDFNLDPVWIELKNAMGIKRELDKISKEVDEHHKEEQFIKEYKSNDKSK